MWLVLAMVALGLIFISTVGLNSTSSAAVCPSSCPPPADPTGLGCTYGFRNCNSVLGSVTEKCRVRKSVSGSITLSCNSCNEKNKGSVSGGFATTTVDYSWTVNLPDNLGSFSGGGSEVISGETTLNCVDCANISAPHVKYNTEVTLNVPYTIISRTGFRNTACWIPFKYTLVVSSCSGVTQTTVYSSYEYSLEETNYNSCPSNNQPPCGIPPG
jgi:hypothetical protein